MTIQLSKNLPQVRIGDRFFPAIVPTEELARKRSWSPPPVSALPKDLAEIKRAGGELFRGAFSYRIPIGETGNYISVSIGYGSYSDNYHNEVFDPFAEMDCVEIAPLDKDGDWLLAGQVLGRQTSADLLAMIESLS